MSVAEHAPYDSTAYRRLAALGLEEGMLEGYGSFLGALDDAPGVPARVLTLCRMRVKALHGLSLEPGAERLEPGAADALRRGELGGFSVVERSALALVDSVCFAPHAMTDQEVQSAVAAFGATGTVGLLTAIALADADCRLQLTLPAPSAGDF